MRCAMWTVQQGQHDDDGVCIGRNTQEQSKLARPNHLVDETSKAGEEKAGNDQQAG